MTTLCNHWINNGFKTNIASKSRIHHQWLLLLWLWWSGCDKGLFVWWIIHGILWLCVSFSNEKKGYLCRVEWPFFNSWSLFSLFGTKFFGSSVSMMQWVFSVFVQWGFSKYVLKILRRKGRRLEWRTQTDSLPDALLPLTLECWVDDGWRTVRFVLMDFWCVFCSVFWLGVFCVFGNGSLCIHTSCLILFVTDPQYFIIN